MYINETTVIVSFTIYMFYLQAFDPNSAFFTKVINKKKKTLSGTDSSGKKGRSKHGSDEESEELDPVVLRSRQLASKAWFDLILLSYILVHVQ